MSPEMKAGILVLAVIALAVVLYLDAVISMGSGGYVGGYTAGNR